MEGPKKIVFHILNKHAPVKRKYIRANEALFMTKDLHNAFIKRTKLKSKFLKSNTSYRKNHTSQRNLCKKLLKNTKRHYSNTSDVKKVTDNGTLWKLFQTMMNYAKILMKFSQKQLISLKFRILQTINLITLMIHSKKHSNNLKIT